MQRLWGSGGVVAPAFEGGRAASVSSGERAARAVRYGVSEMGLMLNVDGRDCPGCDAPGRFCIGTVANVQAPAGISSGAVVDRMNQLFGRQ
jgi:hypothetical protein